MKSNKKILMVDDDEDDIMLFSEALREVDKRIECVGVQNGEEALKMLRETADGLFDYIFLDLNMPRLNGKECLREIKKSKNLSRIPVIVYTTSKLEEDVLETKELGASYFLTKPNSFDDLVMALSFVLNGETGKMDGLKKILKVFKQLPDQA